jgi:hypothetical protein
MASCRNSETENNFVITLMSVGTKFLAHKLMFVWTKFSESQILHILLLQGPFS